MTPKEVVDALEAIIGVLGPPKQLRDAVESALLMQPSVSKAAAAEQSDILLHKVKKEISQRQRFRDAAGEIAILTLRDGTDILVSGSSYVFQDDSVEAARIKRNRVLVDSIHDAMIALDFSQFERFGSKVLREIGAKISRYTRHAGDQGIDFFGEITVGHLLNADEATFKLLHETRLVVVGQAKHYPNRTVGPGIVRELVGALSLSRTATFSNGDVDMFDEVRLRPFTPVLAMLFSTGDFTRGARTLAGRAGLIVFSGWQLSVFLADKGIGIVDVAGQASFGTDRFLQWVEQ